PDWNSDRTSILIKPGVYMGQFIVPPSKTNLTMLGSGAEHTILSYALTVHDPIPPNVPIGLNGYGFVALGDGFQAADLTFRQLAGDHGQAIALRVDADRVVLSHCRMEGWQDTVRLERGRHYLRDCRIEGRVDYLYGGAAAVFEECELHTKNDGYVTAASTPAEQKTGYVFLRCRVTGTQPARVYLGRPWRPHAHVAWIDCEMDESVRPEGWDNWRNPQNEQTVRYEEFGSRGPGATADRRVAWSRQLTEVEAGRYRPDELLRGEDGWSPQADWETLRRAREGSQRAQ
ncbi:MAG: hypothetical protein KDA61_17685, partial [Planctomycetales bacterium]|nr:hypothetical protein [Planctomycetales bacterium]